MFGASTDFEWIELVEARYLHARRRLAFRTLLFEVVVVRR